MIYCSEKERFNLLSSVFIKIPFSIFALIADRASLIRFLSVIVTTAPLSLEPRLLYLIFCFLNAARISSTKYSDFSLRTVFVSTSSNK